MAADLDRVEHIDGQQPLPGMPEDGVLFHVEHGPAEKPESYGRRLTARQHADVAAGRHPLTRGRALPELGTCGDCRFRELIGWHDRAYPKCQVGPRSHGPATDVRAWWPACHRYVPRWPKDTAEPGQAPS